MLSGVGVLLVDVVDSVQTYYVDGQRVYFDYKIQKDLEVLMIKVIHLFQ